MITWRTDMSLNQKNEASTTQAPVVVFYHQECSDGFGAALSAWLKYTDKTPITLTPLSYGDTLPALPTASDVYILDFSLPVDVFLELRKNNFRVSMIDHHQTAQEHYGQFFAGDRDIIFDKKSVPEGEIHRVGGQRRVDFETSGEFPCPKVLVLNIADKGGHFCARVKVKPGQGGSRVVHVEDDIPKVEGR